jgi:hypothetical protein
MRASNQARRQSVDRFQLQQQASAAASIKMAITTCPLMDRLNRAGQAPTRGVICFFRSKFFDVGSGALAGGICMIVLGDVENWISAVFRHIDNVCR